jgi:hypothetical protein
MPKLGSASVDQRGFPKVDFKDLYGADAYVSASSIILDDVPGARENPGSSALWLGVKSANPQIMARDAKRFGVETEETTGWVPFPVPDEVLLTTQMHLSREQVEGLVSRLTEWLNNGSFED